MQICQHFKNTMDFFLFLLHKKHVIWYCLLQSGWVWILTTTVSCCGYFLVQIIGPCHQVEKISFTQTKLSCVGKYSTFSITFVFRVIAWNISVLLTGLCVVLYGYAMYCIVYWDYQKFMLNSHKHWSLLGSIFCQFNVRVYNSGLSNRKVSGCLTTDIMKLLFKSVKHRYF